MSPQAITPNVLGSWTLIEKVRARSLRIVVRLSVVTDLPFTTLFSQRWIRGLANVGSRLQGPVWMCARKPPPAGAVSRITTRTSRRTAASVAVPEAPEPCFSFSLKTSALCGANAIPSCSVRRGANRSDGEFGAHPDAELPVDPIEMPLYGRRVEVQQILNLSVRRAPRHEQRDLALGRS
jgi:hypothetical protein